MSAETECTFQIRLEKPPVGIDFGLQKGHGNSYETIQKQRSANGDLYFDFSAKLKETPNAEPDFLGPFVQGPKGGRFVYIGIGTYAGEANSPWGRRLKIPLTGINSAMIGKLNKDSLLIFVTTVPGTGKDGGPNCATVKPFAGWQVSKKMR